MMRVTTRTDDEEYKMILKAFRTMQGKPADEMVSTICSKI